MSQELVTITVDGKQVQVPNGQLLVEAAKAANVDIPVFCYHKKLDPAGVCRMCLVDVEGQRKPVTACTMPVSDGMVVHTETPEVQALQRGVIEFLLLNHPLDCPVCDKGGECPLQDNTYRWGVSGSRSLDPKFRRRKAVDLGQFIVLDEERCILCRRCTRFDDEISQEENLIIAERAHLNVVTTAQGDSFDSYFSGNTIELCPVGALTSDLYRFKSRPWDLASVPSVCNGCSVGCNTQLDFRMGKLLRVLARENEDIDDGWLCDRGRFNFEYVQGEHRITRPMIRKDGELTEVTWEEALSEITVKLREIKRDHGAESIGAIGGGRLSNEEAYLFQKMVRTTFGSPHVDWRSGEQYVASSGDFPGKISDVSRSTGILLVDVQPAERAPVLDLRIRRTAERGGALVASVGPVMPTYRSGCKQFQVLPGEIAPLLEGEELVNLYEDIERLTVVWSGRHPEIGVALHGLLTRLKNKGTEVHLLIPGEQSNARGAEAFGVRPDLLPGYRDINDPASREDVESAWQTALPTSAGWDTESMLEKVLSGDLQAMYVASANLTNTMPDRTLVERALEEVPFLIVQDMFVTETAALADVVLPVAAFPEKGGHFTSVDGTVQHVKEPAMRTEGDAKSDGHIFAQISRMLGVTLYNSEQELQWEMDHFVGEKEGTISAAAPESVLVDNRDGGERSNVSRVPTGADGDLILIPVEKLYAGGGTAHFDQGLRRARPKAVAIFHPDDALNFGVEDGDHIALEALGSEVGYTVNLSKQVMAGTVHVPKGLFEAPANALGSGRLAVRIVKSVAEEVS